MGGGESRVGIYYFPWRGNHSLKERIGARSGSFKSAGGECMGGFGRPEMILLGGAKAGPLGELRQKRLNMDFKKPGIGGKRNPQREKKPGRASGAPTGKSAKNLS